MQKVLKRSGNVKKLIAMSSLSLAVIVVDLITKNAIIERVSLYESIRVLPFLNIVHVENRGAAFGLFTGLGNTFFMIVSAAAIVIIILYAIRISWGMELFSLSLILGGAAGNLIDRVRYAKVIDFIDIFVGTWHWPAFNVADSALTTGIVLLLWKNIMMMRQGRKA